MKKGFSVIPLRARGKKPQIDTWLEFQNRKPSEEELQSWFGNGSSLNIGIVTGPVSGLSVVDLDGPDAVEFANLNNFPLSPMVKTGKGFHAYFSYREGSRNFQKRHDLPHIDLRSSGGYVVAPPSIHQNGHTYSWVSGRTLNDLSLPPLPEIILTKSLAEKKPLHGLYRGAPVGSRNDTLARLCGSWVNDRLTFEECLEQASVWNQRNDPPLPLREVEQTVRSIFRKHQKEKGKEEEGPWVKAGFNFTDLGNARRFVAAHGADVKFCYPWRKWLIWDGTRWQIDNSGEVERRAKDTVRLIYGEAAEAVGEKRRKDLAKHALRSESEPRIKAIVELSKSEPGIPILPEEMDRDPWALNVGNGTINLRTGELRRHAREDRITKLAPVEFRPEAECPFWLEHLDRIFAGNQDMIAFLHLAFGYSTTALNDERVIFIQHGSGANGKSTTNETVAEILGDYAARTPTESILVRREDGIRNDLARLRGARFVFCSEADEGRRLAESLIKDLTGGDRITARFLRAEYFEYAPTFKIWLSTNHKPVVRGTDNAIWDRIRLIPFNLAIPPEERIPRSRMMEKLAPEFPGILAWLVRGAQDWSRFGLGTPREVQEATREYRADMDVIGGFLHECCLISRGHASLGKDIYEAYLKWCAGNGENAISQRRFGRELTERGFIRKRTTAGAHQWVGIGIIVT